MAANLERPLPYYRFYVTDYRASRRVQRLDYVQRGLYRELIDECWVKGAIPDDITRLADICDCPVGVMAEAWPTLRGLFRDVDGMGGAFLYSERLDAERTTSDKLRLHRQLAGRKGGVTSSKVKQSQAKSSKCHIAVAEQSNSSSMGKSQHGTATGRINAPSPTVRQLDGRPMDVLPDSADPLTPEQEAEWQRTKDAIRGSR